jgi:hypothetical protein
LVEAKGVTIDTGKSWRDRARDPLVEFLRRHSYPNYSTYAEWSREFAPHLMMGDS